MQDEGLYLVGLNFGSDDEASDLYLLYVMSSDLYATDTIVKDAQGNFLVARRQSDAQEILVQADESFRVFRHAPENLHCTYKVGEAIRLMFDPEGFDRDYQILDSIILFLDCMNSSNPKYLQKYKEVLVRFQSRMTVGPNGRDISAFFDQTDDSREDVWSAICSGLSFVVRNCRFVSPE